MDIVRGLDFELNRPSAIAMGKFDGVHLGHRLLIADILKEARENDYQSVIFTFNPSPESLFSGRALPEITTASEKRSIFEKMGIDVLIEFPMNIQTAATPPDEFIRRFLVEQIHAATIVAGTDLSFGYKGLGNSALLKAGEQQYGYKCHIMDKVTYDGEEISSTRIRRLIEAGDMESAGALLGAPFRLGGVVSHGRKLGRTIGMPTANVYIPPDKLMGPRGVYYARVYLDNAVYPATVNVGVKPTVSDDEMLCCESFLHGYEGDLYGSFIEIELLKYVRPEMKFSSVDELKRQMQSDIAGGAVYHEKNNNDNDFVINSNHN